MGISRKVSMLFRMFSLEYESLWEKDIATPESRTGKGAMWEESFQSFSEDLLVSAAWEWINKNRYPPKIADLREIIATLQRNKRLEESAFSQLGHGKQKSQYRPLPSPGVVAFMAKHGISDDAKGIAKIKDLPIKKSAFTDRWRKLFEKIRDKNANTNGNGKN